MIGRIIKVGFAESRQKYLDRMYSIAKEYR